MYKIIEIVLLILACICTFLSGYMGHTNLFVGGLILSIPYIVNMNNK